jgi:hypothetical protein
MFSCGEFYPYKTGRNPNRIRLLSVNHEFPAWVIANLEHHQGSFLKGCLRFYGVLPPR